MIMTKLRFSITVTFLIAALSALGFGQLWSNVLSSSRATDWTGVGISGGVPSGSWAQCVTSACNIVTAAGTSVTTAQITTALASAPSNTYVLLGPGTFNLTGKISYPSTGHVVLRGSGANSTFLVPSASGTVGCQLQTCLIDIESSDGPYFNQPQPTLTAWTAGYAQGSNQITLGSVAGISTSNPTMIFMEQCETGYTASGPTAACTGSSVDNGQLFICADGYSGGMGCSSNGPGNQDTHRGQMEMSVATNVTGSVVTLADNLEYPNWASGQTPRVWLQQPIVMVGVENLAIDDSAASTSVGVNDAISLYGAYQWWVSGVKISKCPYWAIEAFQTQHGIVQNSYITDSTGGDSYGVRFEGGGHNLIQNNIFTRVFAPIVFDGPSAGDVIAYNFTINDNYQSDFLRGSYFEHDVNAYDLFEGNVATNQVNDGDHGTANFITRYRNFFFGWESCANGQCGSSTFKDGWTNAFQDVNYERYENNVGNVLGTPGFHTTYQTSGTSGWNLAVEVLGGINSGIPADPLNKTTSMFWGNYDTVNATARFVNAEVPSGISPYPNSVPSSQTLPPSFYLSSKPAWFGTHIWPPIGPDVTGGNVGQCTGTLNAAGKQAGVAASQSSQCTGTTLASAWAGHVSLTPAMDCYLNIMGGKPDGTGSVLSFNSNACYAVGIPPGVPTSLNGTVN